MQPRFLRSLAAGVVLLGVAAAGACTTQRVQPAASDQMAGMAPMLSVERFMQAVNARELDAMASLFGTADGPVEGDPQYVERWMAAMAEILRHSDYEIVSERRAVGYAEPTTRIGVTITQGRRVVRDVPFLVVRTRDGGWLVQEIDLERITGS